MQENKESFLDPTKEIPVDGDLKLEGFPLEYEKQMSHIQKPYDKETPIKVGTYSRGKSSKDLDAYRKKRKQKNKQAKKSRKINRKKK